MLDVEQAVRRYLAEDEGASRTSFLDGFDVSKEDGQERFIAHTTRRITAVLAYADGGGMAHPDCCAAQVGAVADGEGDGSEDCTEDGDWHLSYAASGSAILRTFSSPEGAAQAIVKLASRVKLFEVWYEPVG